MRTGTDATGEHAIASAADFITANLRAKNERVDDKARMRIERDVAGVFAWLVTRYRLADDGTGRLEALAKKFIAGALEVDDLRKWTDELS